MEFLVCIGVMKTNLLPCVLYVIGIFDLPSIQGGPCGKWMDWFVHGRMC